MGNLPWLFGVIFIFWIMWFAAGGPESGRTDRPFLLPLSPVGTGEIYGPKDLVPSGKIIQRRGEVQKDTKTEELESQKGDIVPEEELAAEEITEDKKISIFGGKVSFTFRGKTGARIEDPAKEYIEIIASRNNSQPINITGWKVKSAVTGRSVSIEKGSYLPYSGRINTEERIFLRPGEKAIIATGRSPIGVSFRLNLCTGYFEQFQNFTPVLPRECPYPKNEDLPPGLSDACLDFIDRLPRCEVFIKAIPLSLASDPLCHEYLSGDVTYNSCVETHKSESGFYKQEWRIYLRRNDELWKLKRETILLLDDKEKTVDSISY